VRADGERLMRGEFLSPADVRGEVEAVHAARDGSEVGGGLR
jgi:hypothetical protein